jgi:hypothetical protein
MEEAMENQTTGILLPKYNLDEEQEKKEIVIYEKDYIGIFHNLILQVQFVMAPYLL